MLRRYGFVGACPTPEAIAAEATTADREVVVVRRPPGFWVTVGGLGVPVEEGGETLDLVLRGLSRLTRARVGLARPVRHALVALGGREVGFVDGRLRFAFENELPTAEAVAAVVGRRRGERFAPMPWPKQHDLLFRRGGFGGVVSLRYEPEGLEVTALLGDGAHFETVVGAVEALGGAPLPPSSRAPAT